MNWSDAPLERKNAEINVQILTSACINNHFLFFL
jgi:hypothetical protein